MGETEELIGSYKETLTEYEKYIQKALDDKFETYVDSDVPRYEKRLANLESKLGDKINDLIARKKELMKRTKDLLQRNERFRLYLVQELFLKNKELSAKFVGAQYLDEVSCKEPKNDAEREVLEVKLELIEGIVGDFREALKTYAQKAKGKDENYYIVHFILRLYSDIYKSLPGLRSSPYIAQVIAATNEAKTPQEKLDKILELTK